MVVNAGAVKGRPHLQYCHASWPKAFVRKQLKTNIACPVAVNFLKHLLLGEESPLVALSFEELELSVLLLALHFVEVVHDAERNAFQRVTVG